MEAANRPSVTPEEAIRRILHTVTPAGTERISVFEANGRVMAEPLESRRDLPPWPGSAMDGYAVRHRDIVSPPVGLTVTAELKAGDPVDGILVQPGQAVRIMTGARMPAGADTVVEQEVTSASDGTVTINIQKKPGANVRMAAEDIASGSPLDYTGIRLTPGHIARLVSTGNVFFSVYRAPRVAVISTGNELCDAAAMHPDRLIDANGRYILALLQEHGIDATFMGIAHDDDDSFDRMMHASRSFDAVITSGGISEGDFDVVSMKAGNLGVSWLFRGVNQKPGRPFSAGVLDGKPLFALPGNPVAAGVNMLVYVLPALRKLSGLARYENPTLEARLVESTVKKKKRTHFDRATVSLDTTSFTARLHEKQDSHVIDSLTTSNALVILPEAVTGTVPAGTIVTCIPFHPGTILGG